MLAGHIFLPVNYNCIKAGWKPDTMYSQCYRKLPYVYSAIVRDILKKFTWDCSCWPTGGRCLPSGASPDGCPDFGSSHALWMCCSTSSTQQLRTSPSWRETAPFFSTRWRWTLACATSNNGMWSSDRSSMPRWSWWVMSMVEHACFPFLLCSSHEILVINSAGTCFLSFLCS